MNLNSLLLIRIMIFKAQNKEMDEIVEKQQKDMNHNNQIVFMYNKQDAKNTFFLWQGAFETVINHTIFRNI